MPCPELSRNVRALADRQDASHGADLATHDVDTAIMHAAVLVKNGLNQGRECISTQRGRALNLQLQIRVALNDNQCSLFSRSQSLQCPDDFFNRQF